MSLIWIRDNYDTNTDRYIDADENEVARQDWLADRITTDQFREVIAAYNDHTLLPEYETEVTWEWVRDNYDTIIKDRYIDIDERDVARKDWTAGTITTNELMKVIVAYNEHTLLPAYGTSPSHVISFVVPRGSVLKVDGAVR